MLPVDFPESNFVYTRPTGLPECGDLRVWKGGHYDLPIVLSKWKPSVRDIAAMNRGESIWLSVYSSDIPPVALFTGHPFDTEFINEPEYHI